MFTLIKDSLLLTKKPLWERKKNLQRHSQSTRPIFSLALSLCLQISIPTYIHTFLVLSPICHRNNNLNVQSLNTRNKNLWIAGDLRICRVTDEKKTLLKVCVHSVELHTHTHTAQCQHYSVCLQHTGTLVQVKIKMLPSVTPVPEPAD